MIRVSQREFAKGIAAGVGASIVSGVSMAVSDAITEASAGPATNPNKPNLLSIMSDQRRPRENVGVCS